MNYCFKIYFKVEVMKTFYHKLTQFLSGKLIIPLSSITGRQLMKKHIYYLMLLFTTANIFAKFNQIVLKDLQPNLTKNHNNILSE